MSPDCSIKQHSVPEFIYSESLYKEEDVIILRCDGILNNACLTFDAFNVNYTDNDLKNKTCRNCIKKRTIIESNSKFKSFTLDYFVSTKDLNNIKSSIDEWKNENLIKYHYKGIEVGRYCLYELILKNKKNDLILSDDDYFFYRAKILNSCIIIFALELLLNKYRFKSFYAYNPLYSHNRCASLYLQKMGLITYGFHAGNNFSVRLKKLSLFEGNQTKQELRILDNWDNYKEKIFPNKEMVDQVFEHLRVMIYSKFWGQYGVRYSSSNVREYFKIPKTKKVYLATLSSSDERFAANTIGVKYFSDKGEIFKDQIDWVKFLINYLKDNEHIHLIIRIHPRDYSNARYPGNSKNADLLTQLLSDLPCNISYNTPEDNFSIFDLAHEVNLLLNYHSSSGREFALLGIPVLIHSKSVHTFTTDFCIRATTLENYKNHLINYELENSISGNMKCALKWLCFEHFYNTLDLNLPRYFYQSELNSRPFFFKLIIYFKKMLPNITFSFELKYFKYRNRDNKFSKIVDPYTGKIKNITLNKYNNFDFFTYYLNKLKNFDYIINDRSSRLSKNILKMQ